MLFQYIFGPLIDKEPEVSNPDNENNLETGDQIMSTDQMVNLCQIKIEEKMFRSFSALSHCSNDELIWPVICHKINTQWTSVNEPCSINLYHIYFKKTKKKKKKKHWADASSVDPDKTPHLPRLIWS